MNIRHAFLVIVPAFVVVFGAIGIWQASPAFVAQMHLGRADELVAQERYQLAIQQYDTALAEEPDLAGTVYLDKAGVYFSMHDYKSALGQCDEDIKVSSGPAPAYVMRAKVHFAQSEYEAAITDCNEALNLTNGPSMIEAYFVRGMAYLQLNNSTDAANDLRVYLVLATPSKTLAPTYNTLAKLYGSSGQSELAIKDFSKAIQLDHGYVEAYYNRGVTYKNIGKSLEALADFKKVTSLATDPQLIDEANQQIKALGSD